MKKSQAEKVWKQFIARLEETDPLIFHGKDGSYQLPHTNFLGSISKYRKMFLDANISQDEPPVPGILVELPPPPTVYTTPKV